MHIKNILIDLMKAENIVLFMHKFRFLCLFDIETEITVRLYGTKV